MAKSKTPTLSNMSYYSKGNEKTGFVTEKDFSEKRKDRFKSWITLYRLNPSFFAEQYFGIKLYFYQRFMLNLMARSTEFAAIASRASAKSWLIGVYAIVRCTLYPGTIVALSSRTKAQAGLIISEKIKALYDSHPNVRREISNITTNQNKWQADFYNVSKVNVVISGEGGRGHRAHVTVLEERRLIPNEVNPGASLIMAVPVADVPV